MYFVGANGQPIGTSLKALSSQWKILQHPDAPHEEGLEGLRMQKGWRWSRFRRQLEFALSGVQGDSSPLRLLAYSFFLPRSVVAELRDLITQHIIEKGPDGKVALIQSASIFAWKSIREPVVDDKDSAEVSIFLTEIRSAYESWTKQCSTLCQKVEKSMEKLESSFDSSNPIILLSRWSNLYRKAGHLEFSRIVEEESYLAGKLADTVGLKLDWSFRVLLHEFILQQCPRSKKQDTGFGALIKEVREKALSPQEVLSKLQNAALENHSSSIDKYLGLYLPKISLPPGVGNTGQPKRSLDRRDDHAQGSKRFRPSTTIRPVATTQLLKNADGSFKKASEVFSLAPSEISNRKQNGQCFKCGKRGHLAKDCPGSTGETPDEHKAEQGLELDQNRLSIVSVTVAQSTGSTDYCPARAGIDSMASVTHQNYGVWLSLAGVCLAPSIY
ncbi:hypothetical protein FOZ60_006763 [Perkinsus olseni]|uniref:CCHC-type domain-containing protein n=1 Tax=Perkinsus olseni TaxID=32597 RepID=A0A7J6NNF0_PEROL|nr:hypothetical protein FOZ60_006763 [Perkinsus olseni]